MQHEAAVFTVQDVLADGKSLEESVMEEQRRFGVWLLQRWLGWGCAPTRVLPVPCLRPWRKKGSIFG